MGDITYQSPVYLQMREVLRAKIETGEYLPGTAIPSECRLAETYGINRQTVHKAIDTLISEGLLKRVQGKGVYVLGKKMERDLDELQGFTQTMLDRHVTPSVKVLSRTLREAGEKYSLMFGIQPEQKIYYIKRLCFANDEPISLEEIFIPRYLVPKLEGIDLSVFSVYEIYSIYGIQLERARQTLDVVHLGANDAKILGIDAGHPVLLFECTTYDDKGRIVEFDRNYARDDKCTFSVRFDTNR